jgi:hypothetical protein
LVTEDEGEEDEEVGVGDLEAGLGGWKNEDDVAKEDSGQEEEAQKMGPDVDRFIVKKAAKEMDSFVFYS